MKSLSKMTLVSLLVGLMLSSISFNASSQGKDKGKGKDNLEKSAGAEKSKVDKLKVFNLNELEGNWTKYTKDPNFKILLDDLKKKGFTRIEKNEKTSWGYEGKLLRDSLVSSVSEAVEICAFDFHKKTATGGQMASMVWRKVGNEIYKCYMIFPENDKDTQNALEKTQEFTVTENGKIEPSNSLGRCWSKCVFERFSAFGCAGAMALCTGAAVGLVAAGLGVTTGVALAILFSCAGVFCLSPLAICLAYCF